MTLRRLAAIVAIAVGLVTIAVLCLPAFSWFAHHVAWSAETEIEVPQLKQAVIDIRSILERQEQAREQEEAITEAERALLLQLCAEGKLDGDDCPPPEPPP